MRSSAHAASRKNRSSLRASTAPGRRRARVDLLEGRRLLSVSAAEYDALRSTYPDFALPADLAQVNLIEITPEQLSVASLKAAITSAAGTTLPDLVVLRTSDTQHAIAYASAADALSIDIPASKGSISLVALGSQKLTLDGRGYAGVLSLGSANSSTRVNLGNLQITGGLGPALYPNFTGGTPDGATVGGIYLLGGTAMLRNMTIDHNLGTGLCQASGTLSVTDSTLRANGDSGFYQYDGSASLANVIVQYNQMTERYRAMRGAGICQILGSMTLTNATVVDNIAVKPGTTTLPQGGGIYTHLGYLTLNNSIVARNVSNSGPDLTYGVDGYYHGTITGSNNLIGDGSGIAQPWSQPSLINGVNGNLVGSYAHPIDPLLAEGTGFGTGLAPLPGSPALGAGSAALVPAGLTTDIYGNLRPSSGPVTIGAVQVAVPLRPAVTYVVDSLEDSLATDGQLTLREALAAANSATAVGDAPAGSYSSTNRIEFAPGLSGTIATHGQAYQIRSSVDLVGPGSDKLALDAQVTSGVLEIMGLHHVSLQQFGVFGAKGEVDSNVPADGIYKVGVFNVGANLAIDGLNIRGNDTAYAAGGLWQYLGTLSLTNSTLSRNTGTAIALSYTSAELANTTISENAYGMSEVLSSATLTHVVIRDNIYAGCSTNDTSSTLTLKDVTLTGNGSAAIAFLIGKVFLTDVVISNNGSAGSAGDSSVLTNVIISGNSAGWLSEARGTLANVIITGNGGTGLTAGDSVTLRNVTITGNGWGLAVQGRLTMYNTIVAGNTLGPDIFWYVNGSPRTVVPSGMLSGTNNLIGDGSLQGVLVNGVNGNLVGTTANPIDPRLAGGSGFGVGQTPLTGSPAIDAGNPSAIPPGLNTDIYGNPRLQKGKVNIGAVQNVLSPWGSVTYIVNSLEDSLAADGKLTLREALAAANSDAAVGDAPAGSPISPDHIVFAPGLTGTIYTHGQAYLIASDLDLTGPGAATLALDGQGSWRVLEVRGLYAVALRQFTVQGGRVLGDGGGILSATARLTVEDLAITGNAAIAVDPNSGNGGGFSTASGIVTLQNCQISGNTAGTFGGGIYGGDSLTNSVVSGNTASGGGGVFKTKRLTNVTIVGNTAHSGGGLYAGSPSDSSLYNCILARNQAVTVGSSDLGIMSGNGMTVMNSLIGGILSPEYWIVGTGNLWGTVLSPLDPRFVSVTGSDWRQWDLHLRSDSPAVDAGSNTWIPAGITTDLDGHARIAGSSVDMGAYEFSAPPVLASVTINDGALQRSMLKKLTVSFSEPVTLAPDALQVKPKSGALPANTLVAVSNPSGDQQTYVLSFSGSAVVGGSLPDGIYDLSIAAAGVQDLDGNQLTANYTQRFHRLFGDSDGNRIVNALDYARLKQSFGRAPSDPLFNGSFDYENNGLINALDLARFRQRYGMSFSY